MTGRFVVGVDFGTLSGRAVVVRLADGAEVGTAVCEYPHGVLADALPGGRRLPPDWALQVPGDYRTVLRRAVPAAVAAAGIDPAHVAGVAVDATASTVIPTLADGTPLCELPGLAERPHAYAKLWKHHAAQPQADRLNRVAARRGEPWLPRYGGLLSAEWQLAKGLELLEGDPELFARAELWLEAADWITWLLTGGARPVRSAAAAGYKGQWQGGAHPSADYLEAVAPGLAALLPKLAGEHRAGGARAGALSSAAAELTGLPAGTAVAVGTIDAHATAVAAQGVRPGRLVAIMGTSTCHLVNAAAAASVPGACGVVEDGIVAGLWGYEAGQSGTGDALAWFVDSAVPAAYAERARADGVSVHDLLSRLADELEVGESGLLALDWFNGNRSVLVDAELSGAIVGLTLATRPEHVYRALVEATAFGTRVIVEAYRAAGVPVTDVVVAGGLSRNPMLRRIYADVLGLPLSVVDSAHEAALGAAVAAAVAAGAFPDLPTAAGALTRIRPDGYRPDPQRTARYDELYAHYLALHDHFGRHTDVLRALRGLRRDAIHRRTGA